MTGVRDRSAAGRLEVVCGCMFSGKSEELIRRLVRADIARQRVMAVKPMIDDRYDAAAIASHAGRRWPCVTVNSGAEILAAAADNDPDVVGIEEAQFFDDELIAAVDEMVSAGRRVICAGLDLDAFARPFGPMPALMCAAEQVTKLSAVCVICGADAYRSQLLLNGRHSRQGDGPLVHVGAGESYEARCRKCFQLPSR